MSLPTLSIYTLEEIEYTRASASISIIDGKIREEYRLLISG